MSSEHFFSELNYTVPVDRLNEGHSYGNSHIYLSLDHKTDVKSDQSTVRYGVRESLNQQYYLLGWEVSLQSSDGKVFSPISTTFAPVYQETQIQMADVTISKKVFVPFENNYLRSVHYLLDSNGVALHLLIKSRAFFPATARVNEGSYRGHRHLIVRYGDGGKAVLWGSGNLLSFSVKEVQQKIEVLAEFAWESSINSPEYSLSFSHAAGVYGTSASSLSSLSNDSATLPTGSDMSSVEIAPLNAVVDIFSRDDPSYKSTITRVQLLEQETLSAMNRYLNLGRLLTPDRLLNRAVQWAKINQLRDQQEYKWGSGFSNSPPSDTVVGRDSVWYLMGSSYYAQPWSRRLLDLWFTKGLDVNGKFTEYMSASRDPFFKDDYGLNINDSTPLFMIAAYHYYSLTKDRDFLQRVYPSLLNSANLILDQRKVGTNNKYNLVWCTSTETFIRGLCGWRNAIRDYNLSGAVTEINVECHCALKKTAELAKEVGDQLNQERLETAAEDLRGAIERHLRSSTKKNPFYYLNIAPTGKPVDDLTADLLFPVLFELTDSETAKAILETLFSDQFWISSDNGGGGVRTVSSKEEKYTPRADPDTYGLMGGVWPNVALWVARASAAQGFPDLALKALRSTYLLSERDDPARYNVMPGQLPEYFNGDDLVQRGQPRSTFLFGIFIWAALESFLGLKPSPAGLEVAPQFPEGWEWIAVSNLPHNGYPASMIAVRNEKTIYSTMKIRSGWKQVTAPQMLQEKYALRSEGQPFWMVVPNGDAYEVLAVSSEKTTSQLIEVRSGRVVTELAIPENRLVRKML